MLDTQVKCQSQTRKGYAPSINILNSDHVGHKIKLVIVIKGISSTCNWRININGIHKVPPINRELRGFRPSKIAKASVGNKFSIARFQVSNFILSLVTLELDNLLIVDVGYK
jgi:hypothetical protein